MSQATKTAVIYGRVSTAKQAAEELSVPAQIEHGRRKAAELDASVLRVFTDDGASAFYARRPAFEDAVLYCELNSVDLFITWSPSRFSRDKIAAGVFKRRLEAAGTKLVYCSMRIDTETTEGFVLDTVMEMVAELYSRELRADTLRSMMRNARAGYWGGGSPPFGYRSLPAADNPKRKRLAIIDDEATVARRIFEAAADGQGAATIAKNLNAAGFTNRGKRWNKTVIGYLLRNETLAGRIVFGRTDRRTGRVRPRADWIIVDSHSPIIDADLWQRVQKHLDGAAPGGASPTAANSGWRFSGLIQCGDCGAAMHIEQATGRSRRYGYYICSEARRHGAHPPRRVRADLVEDWLVEQIAARVFTPEFLAETLREMRVHTSEWKKEQDAQRDAVASQIRTIERKNENLYSLLEDLGSETPNLGDLTRRLRANNAQITKLEAQLTEIETAPAPALPEIPGSVEALGEIALETIRTAEPSTVRAFLSEWVSRITLHDDHIAVEYRPDRIVGASGAVHTATVWLPATAQLRTMRLPIPDWWPLAA